MATQVQFRRGTTSQHGSFTGAVGEVTVDTDKDTVVVHDGSQAGGFAIPNLKTAQEFTKTQNFNATSLSDGSTIAWDASSNQVAKVTLGGNRTLAAATNQVDGAVYVLSVTQDGSGSRTLSFNSNYKFTGGTAPTLTTTAAGVDAIVWVARTSTKIACQSILNLS